MAIQMPQEQSLLVSNSTLTANFEKRKYPLTINFEGEGEVLEEIVNAGRTTEYDSGTTVKLTAQAAAEWVVCWLDRCYRIYRRICSDSDR